MILAREVVAGLALFLAPAVALSSWLKAGGALRRWGLAAMLSPVALGLTVLPLRLAGLASLPAGLAALGAWTAIAVLRRGALPGRPDAEEREVLRRVLWVLPLVLVPAMLNHYLLVRSDAWFHAAVSAQVRNLPVPPQDPYYAGIRLGYFWFYHLILATYDSVAGLSPFVSMWLFNCLYFALTLAGAYRLSRLSGASHRASLWTPWLVAAGANPLGWAWVLVHVWRDPAHWGMLSQHLPDYGYHLIGWGYASPAVSFGLDKFIVATAFSWGTAIFTWWMLSAAEFWDRGRNEHAVLAGLLGAAALMMHTFVGLAVYLTAAAAVGLALLSAFSRARLARAAWLGAWMAAGLVAAYSYVRVVTQGKPAGVLPQAGFNPGMVWTVLWVGLGLLPFVLVAGPAIWKRGGAARLVLLATAVVLGTGWVVKLYYGNESKFMLLGMPPLAALAAPAVRRFLGSLFPTRPALRVAALAGLYGPTTAFGLACMLLANGRVPYRPDPPPVGAQEQGTYRWLRDNTPPATALLVRPGTLQALVRAERAQVWTRCAYADAWGYPAEQLDPRQHAAEAAFGAGLAPRDLEFLRSMNRPVYRVSRAGEAPAQPCFAVVRREGPWVVERLNLKEGR